MPTLSAPTIREPLYECSPYVVVYGYVPGATLAIYAIPPGGGAPARIGGGVSMSPVGQVFGATVALMVAGARLYATQTLNADTSPPSPEIILQRALDLVAPRLDAPLLECARCMRVGGLLPGATAEVRDGAALLGRGDSAAESVHVRVAPPLQDGQLITARQTLCGVSGPDAPGVGVGMTKEARRFLLPPPEVREPLYACQPFAVVDSCTPGCQVDLFIDMQPVTGTCSGGGSESFRVSGGLKEGTSVTAQQHLCGGTIKSNVSAAVVVRPADDIPQPVIRSPLYEGDTSVVTAMTVAGEVVTIEADAAQIGMGGAGGGDATLNVDPPLVAGQSIVASVELCQVSKRSLPVIVRRRPAVIPTPEVVEPLFACSQLVGVRGCIPGAKVRVYASAAHTVLIGTDQTFENTIMLLVTPLLQVGYKITATQEVGGVTSPVSNPVVVQLAGGLATPVLRTPIYECARCVHVEQVMPGARVDVYQDGIWVGGADAPAKVVDVAVYPPLTLGATITATQSLCGQVSEPAETRVTETLRKLPSPTITSAFAGSSSVIIENLIPGALVEVEEIDTYNLVIGRGCALGEKGSIGLSLPLFAGARLRARQRLCVLSPYSSDVKVGQPPEWPLGEGRFRAGFRLVADIPISAEVEFTWSETAAGGEPYRFERPAQNRAVVFYPATGEAEDASFAAGGPFPLIVFCHSKRFPESAFPDAAVCPGAPADFTQDYRQSSGILAQLARWGFVTIAPDLSWLARQSDIQDWQLTMRDALSYMIAENARAGSPFQHQLRPAGLGAIGHSTGGLAAIFLGTSDAHPIDALGLIAPVANVMHDVSHIIGFAPKPILILHGTQELSAFGVNGDPLSYYAAAGPKKHLVTIGGANHFGYTDAVCIQADNHATISQVDQQRIAKAFLTAFFRRYLGGATEVDAYLAGLRPVEGLEALNITVEAQT